jgi:hypothetical protein
VFAFFSAAHDSAALSFIDLFGLISPICSLKVPINTHNLNKMEDVIPIAIRMKMERTNGSLNNF